MMKTKKERNDNNDNLKFDELYQYVKKIMNYDSNQSLSKYQVLRLKGLKTGKFIENKKTKEKCNYSFEIILLTFKYCKINIEKGFKNISFKDENHKFNYMLKIVESNINNVYEKINKRKREESLLEDTEIPTNEYTENYKRKSGDSKRLHNYI